MILQQQLDPEHPQKFSAAAVVIEASMRRRLDPALPRQFAVAAVAIVVANVVAIVAATAFHELPVWTLKRAADLLLTSSLMTF